MVVCDERRQADAGEHVSLCDVWRGVSFSAWRQRVLLASMRGTQEAQTREAAVDV